MASWPAPSATRNSWPVGQGKQGWAASLGQRRVKQQLQCRLARWPGLKQVRHSLVYACEGWFFVNRVVIPLSISFRLIDLVRLTAYSSRPWPTTSQGAPPLIGRHKLRVLGHARVLKHEPRRKRLLNSSVHRNEFNRHKRPPLRNNNKRNALTCHDNNPIPQTHSVSHRNKRSRNSQYRHLSMSHIINNSVRKRKRSRYRNKPPSTFSLRLNHWTWPRLSRCSIRV